MSFLKCKINYIHAWCNKQLREREREIVMAGSELHHRTIMFLGMKLNIIWAKEGNDFFLRSGDGHSVTHAHARIKK